MRKCFLVLITIALLSVPGRLFAWSAHGHQLTAEIAFHFLDDSTKQKVLKYLKKMTIEEASTWMDDMRSNDYYRFMSGWHYINIDSGEIYTPSTEYNIVTVLNAAIGELKHKQTLSAKQINNDLLLIFHLMGDLHQPLHVGYGSDRGGNDKQVYFLAKNDRTNLHSVWDNDIIEDKHINMDSCLELYKKYTPGEIAKVKQINIVGWLRQSRSNLGEVYDFKNDFLDEAYVDKNAVLIEQQLLFGGLRLASILEYIFK